MNYRQLDDAIDNVRSMMGDKRFHHVLGVMQFAVSLALREGLDAEKAATAALLHDCAKGLKARVIEKEMASCGETIPEEDRLFPGTWHALLGAIRAQRQFGVDDPEILDAIRFHPTSTGDPSPLTKLLFVADVLEPTRSYERAGSLRHLARHSLDEAYREAVLSKTGFLKNEEGKSLHPRAVRALASLGVVSPSDGVESTQ
ncbi:MAG: bis(5'-nucleosyl)-tetraphosphatase (symmetrical) YqeK [bacterium]